MNRLVAVFSMNDRETFALKNSLNETPLGRVVIHNEDCFSHLKTPATNRHTSLWTRLLCRELIHATS